MTHHRATAFLLTILVTCIAPSAARTIRYFKAEHGVGATYVKVTTDGSYKVIDREHMGIFLTDEGHWTQAGAVITFSPKDPKKSSYQATENEHNGKTFLSITSPHSSAGSSSQPRTLIKTSMPTQTIYPIMCCSGLAQRPTKPRQNRPTHSGTLDANLESLA